MAYTEDMNMTRSFADEIRAVAKADGRTVYAIARDSGVNSAVVGRFVKGERDVTLRIAEKLCRTLGLELRPQRQRTRKA